jgi:hypothetical protein
MIWSALRIRTRIRVEEDLERATKGEGLDLPRRSEPMEMGTWDIKSGQGYVLFYLNSS